jgi:hypothetical protein
MQHFFYKNHHDDTYLHPCSPPVVASIPAVAESVVVVVARLSGAFERGVEICVLALDHHPSHDMMTRLILYCLKTD